MTEGIFIQRLVGKFKSGVDAIRRRGTASERCAGRVTERYNSGETSTRDVPISAHLPIHSSPTNPESCASSRASVGEISQHKNHSRELKSARSSSEFRCIIGEVSSFANRCLQLAVDQDLNAVESNFTYSYELGDQTKVENGSSSPPTRLPDEPFSSPSTTNASQSWETDSLCSCYFHPYYSNGCESPTHLDPNRGNREGHDHFPSSTDESRNHNHPKSLAKPKLRRVAPVNDLFLAANGAPKSFYQSEGGLGDLK